MRSEELHWAIPAHPFHPFVLHLAGGRKFFVTQPEFLSFGLTITFPPTRPGRGKVHPAAAIRPRAGLPCPRSFDR